MFNFRKFADHFSGHFLKSVEANSCNTKYPILLVHGVGYRDDMVISSWGRIPEYLRHGGARVFLGEAEAWSSFENNAKQLKIRIESILAETHADKVNIIAHSKGGLDARYAISKLGVADKVASLTTVCTPHYGTCIADIVCRYMPEKETAVYALVNFFARFMGDKSPDSNLAIKQLSHKYMKAFNEKVIDAPGVLYQSYGAQMLSAVDDPLYALSYRLLKKYEGHNDGMVSEQSCQWGDFRGITEEVSHLQMTDSITDRISNISIPMLYVDWVRELKLKGF